MKYETRFRCPECENTHWGSELEPECIGDDPEVVEPLQYKRHCHGYIFYKDDKFMIQIKSCRFTWPEKDDYKYFFKVGHFESEEEFKADEALLNKDAVAGALWGWPAV